MMKKIKEAIKKNTKLYKLFRYINNKRLRIMTIPVRLYYFMMEVGSANNLHNLHNRLMDMIDKKTKRLDLTGYYSQWGQDRFAAWFFNQKKYGVFVDIGAYDGVIISNAYFLEKNLGWSGIAVEPSTHLFKLLQQNRNCIFYNGCISDKDGKVQFMSVEGADTLSAIADEINDQHRKRVTDYGDKYKIQEVDCLTLNSLLEQHSFKKIDFLSIDTEGTELNVLKGLDFDKYSVNLIAVENNYSENVIEQYMNSKGFSLLAKLSCDEIYINSKIIND